MTSSRGDGYWRRLVRRFTSDEEQLDADELASRSAASGCRKVGDCCSGEEAAVLGRLRSVALCPTDTTPTLEAELFDGTEGVTLIWLGRRRIPGIEPGRTLRAWGRISERDGQKVLYNPYYELQTSG
ncbi:MULTISPECIES: OB-fold nucleic acid binding domain-containing protein [Actinoalloteichus]|uniref:ATP-dependent DNA helicase RecG n=1 Tax=Actinoalloteichus fjordicus TaxID=1612552 RepID=A0AAC9PRE6_9PSEU|nr:MULTISPECIES: OB-fold nucleic acid binding domain-containing protein [Actinoalloteichus]APU13761.1 ATP-dependent DNA helicase RecG [Actinoalloteichus fjordicus]APU19706.1 ATP-dependent DNA helicase RecG [Actinoalloteichus sp. GBA129-24]